MASRVLCHSLAREFLWQVLCLQKQTGETHKTAPDFRESLQNICIFSNKLVDGTEKCFPLLSLTNIALVTGVEAPACLLRTRAHGKDCRTGKTQVQH